jgi:hypothetical protein
MTFVIQTITVVAILAVVAGLATHYVKEAKENKDIFDILETLFSEFDDPDIIIENLEFWIQSAAYDSQVEYVIELAQLLLNEEQQENRSFDADGKIQRYLNQWAIRSTQ